MQPQQVHPCTPMHARLPWLPLLPPGDAAAGSKGWWALNDKGVTLNERPLWKKMSRADALAAAKNEYNGVIEVTSESASLAGEEGGEWGQVRMNLANWVSACSMQHGLRTRTRMYLCTAAMHVLR